VASPGNGYKIANDVLTEMSYHLVEPVVSTTVTSDIPAGTVTAPVGSTDGIYVGAMLIVGTGGVQEVVTVSAVGVNNFTATFAFAHPAGNLVFAATFPVCQTIDPFFTQQEMLNYVANAQNDYLVRVPFIYTTVAQNFVSTQRTGTMPDDTIQIERISYNGKALREQSQTSMSMLNPGWNQQAAMAPTIWYEDRTGYMTYGLDRVPLNAFSVNLLYAQRDSGVLALTDGFLLPDPFLTYVKYGALAQAFAKDGEQKDSERAKFCQGRFDTGVKIGLQFYKNMMAQEVVGAG
jgi:hypothetical protein